MIGWAIVLAWPVLTIGAALYLARRAGRAA